MVPRRNRPPLLRQSHHCARVQDTEAKQVVKLQTHAVHGPVEATLGVEKGISLRSEDGKMLNVPPRQLRTERISLYMFFVVS